MKLIHQPLTNPVATDSPGIASGQEALWPGLAPFAVGDRLRFPGRGEEIDHLMARLARTVCGESPVVWLHGDSACGKTSLVRAGLMPCWLAASGGRRDWFQVEPERSGRTHIETIAGCVLAAVTDGEESSLDLEGRMRQFTLLIRNDSSEDAAEYLAACFRRARGPGAVGLIFVDQFGRCLDELGGTADFFLRFLRDLSLTGTFPLLVALRSYQVPAIRAALGRAGLPEFGEWMRLEPPPVGKLKGLLSAAPSRRHPEGVMRVESGVVDSLFAELGRWPAALPLVGELLAAVSMSFPDADGIDGELVSWHGGLGSVFSGAVESALAMLDPASDEAAVAFAFERLMIATSAEGETMRSAAYRRVAPPGDPVACALIAALVRGRVLGIAGDSAETATVFWTWPPGLAHWERVRRWRENRRHLDARREAFEKARARWESESRTPVCLLHATGWLVDARALLDRHRLADDLAPDLIDFLEDSLVLDDQLRVERESSRKRLWTLFCGTGALLIMVLIVIATLR